MKLSLVGVIVLLTLSSVALATGEFVTIDKHNPFATGEILVGNYYDRLFRIEIQNKADCNIKDSVTVQYSNETSPQQAVGYPLEIMK